MIRGNTAETSLARSHHCSARSVGHNTAPVVQQQQQQKRSVEQPQQPSSAMDNDPQGTSRCSVCGDPSAGRHYKVLACLGCKTFFRRAIVKKREYICTNGRNCANITKDSRKSCRACRLQKCIEIGMRKEALHPKRDLISTKLYDEDKPRLRPPTPPRVPNKKLDLIMQLTEIDRSARERKFEMFRSRKEAAKLCHLVTSNENMISGYYLDQLRIVSMTDMSLVTKIDLQSMIEWAQSLPIFQSLALYDRTTLLKRFSVFHLVLEHGYYTAKSNIDHVWLISNGSCMPRNVDELPSESQRLVSPDRRWRQEKLYNQMTDRCIDDVAMPMRRLNIMPEELMTLKIILLFQCGDHSNANDDYGFISAESKRLMLQCKNEVIQALFAFYESIHLENYPERFGNVLLSISGIISAASALLESYQVMRLFKIVPFDRITEQLLFRSDNAIF